MTFDVAAAHPEVASLRDALHRRDWTSARALLDAAQPASRAFLIHEGGEQPGIDGLLRYILDSRPDDTAAAAMLGAHLIIMAWKVRTRARAAQVGPEQFERFQEHLRQAEQVLMAAAAHDPRDAAVWVERLFTARGLQLGLSEARRRYDRLARVDPHNLPGQRQLLQSLCPKWGGTWDGAHAFARECMLAAPGRCRGRPPISAHRAGPRRVVRGRPAFRVASGVSARAGMGGRHEHVRAAVQRAGR
jgi:hypothetical protein